MKALIVGCGISGISAKDFLEKQGIICEFAKSQDINATSFDEEYLDRLFCGLSFIVTSPGISFDNLLFKKARERKVKIISEFELGTNNSKGDIIAVTGTNGKTTTVMLIKHLLQNQHKNVFLAGNIGTAVTSVCDKTNASSILILECSSFQLENIKSFSPHIATILNITPDHLNRHKTMKNYIKAKLNITKYQTKNDYLLLNYDDEILMKNIPKTKAKIFYFSTKKRVVGCYVKSGSIYFYDGTTENKLVSLKNVKLVGEHNISNILCAVLAIILETGKLNLLGNLSTFQGVTHRIEYVATIDGVAYFNDSKATNIDSTLVAIKSFKQNINLILGGSDKGYNFDNLFAGLSKNVKNIVAIGETSQKILSSAKKYGYTNISLEKTLNDAVKSLKNKAQSGDIILLSPACASFDQFNNYEERGNVFKKLVKEIALYENDNSFSQKNE